MDQFLLGDILVQMDYAGMSVLPEGNLPLFWHEGLWQGDCITLRCRFESLTPYLGRPINSDNHVYRIYEKNGETYLVYHWGNQYHGFAVFPDRFSVIFSPEMHVQPALRQDWFFSIIAFHRQLLLRNGCVFHASYVDIGGEAVLFTGPSGVGKSTQANLWKQFAHSEIINGDRALIRKRDDLWHVFGYPCCGTSGISLNRTLPLRAIVVLAQAKENWLEEIPLSHKIRALVSAMELYPWDTRELDMAFSLAESIASEVPVIQLHCRPDAEAVEVLKQYLEGKPCHEHH